MHRILALFLLLITISWAQESVPLAGFPKVTLVGNYQPDRGWVLSQVVVKGRAYQASEHSLAVQAALRSRGWDRATPAQRRQLALDWCSQAELKGQEVLLKKPDSFPPGLKFSAPTATISRDGVTSVEIWWLDHSGNVQSVAPRYQQGRWRIGKDGRLQ
ncbi:MAG: hypothetical protein U0931_18235 [Vulcanimicrobiota bacterium]